MERTKYLKEPDLILTGDWHLREDIPICHTGDFEKEQWDAVKFIADLQTKYGCPVICAGDMYHHWKPSPYLLSETIKHLPDKFYTVYGNHDLPQHNLQLANKCGIAVLMNSGKLQVLDDCHWNQEPNKPSIVIHKANKELVNVLVWHIMNYQGKAPWPGCTDPLAAKLLRKYPSFSLIVTSDNHKTFTETYNGRLLVNPGSLTRQTASQANHRPSVFLYYAGSNTVKRAELPFEEGVISREHLEGKEQRDQRISAFIDRLALKGVYLADDGQGNIWDTSISMDFEERLEMYQKKYEIKPSIMEIIYKSIE